MTDDTFELGTMRGPRRLDPRSRWSWFFVDLVVGGSHARRVHLQFYIELDRKGVDKALMGRLDLDSDRDEPMDSGELGAPEDVHVKGREVTFTVTDALLAVANDTDDSTKKPSKLLLGKGVEASSYVSAPHGRVTLVVGEEARYHEWTPHRHGRKLGKVRATVHEVEGLRSRTLAAFAHHNRKLLFEGRIKVNPVTGIASGGSFTNTSESVAVFEDGTALSYGFHDAGSGRLDQVYVYLTPEHSDWLGRLIDENSKWLEAPFSMLALAGSHDSGMYGELHAGLALLIENGELGNFVRDSTYANLALPIVAGMIDVLESIKLQPARAINNVALTQRDPIMSQLRLGTRFFDMRPGWCFHDVIHGKKDRLHHQHAIVPGVDYVSFLADCFTFLGEHEREVVVVELKDDGFVVKEDKLRANGEVAVCTMVPTVEELEAAMAQAREVTTDAGRGVKLGGAAELDAPIGSLLESNKRLIIIDRVHEPENWSRLDSYDGAKYNTMVPGPVMACLDECLASFKKSESQGCILQFQATPTANIKQDIAASFTYSDSSSLLVYSKAVMAKSIYPWIEAQDFTKTAGTLVFLHDFVDGCMTDHAISVSRQRTGLHI